MRALALRRAALLALGVSTFAAVASPAHAQNTAGDRPAPQVSSSGNWEIGVHGGVSLRRIPRGDLSLPAPGPAITTAGPTFPSRRTSSWFFGDGAAMFNDAAADLGIAGRITPLDDALAAMGFANSNDANIGVRVARRVTARWAAEFELDFMPASLGLSDTFADAIETTRGSFQSAFISLLGSGPFTGTLVETTSESRGGRSREIAATGAATYRFAPLWSGSFVPYVTLGGGVMSRGGSLPAIDLEGRYRFSIAVAGFPPVPIDETDRVTVRYTRASALVAVAGGGLRRDVSAQWGFRIDGRVFFGRPTLGLAIDASPSTAVATPAGFIQTFTYPSLQFSNNASTNRQSTLGGEPLDGFVAARGSGLETRVLITVGVFFR
jgi:hypothetical protein